MIKGLQLQHGSPWRTVEALNPRAGSFDGLDPGEAQLLDVEPGLHPARHRVVDGAFVPQPDQHLPLPVEEGEPELGRGSGHAAWRRLRAWQDAGVWDRLHRLVLDELSDAAVLD